MKMVHRGVKECYKMIKKTPTGSFNVSGKNTPQGVVILAADVAPMEVIMRFPLLCEEHSIPYLFVKSRTELGIAAATKRSTSIVILKTEAKQSAASPEDAEKKEYLEGLRSLIALAHTEYATQVQPWLNGIHQDQIAYENAKAAAARE